MTWGAPAPMGLEKGCFMDSTYRPMMLGQQGAGARLPILPTAQASASSRAPEEQHREPPVTELKDSSWHSAPAEKEA